MTRKNCSCCGNQAFYNCLACTAAWCGLNCQTIQGGAMTAITNSTCPFCGRTALQANHTAIQANVMAWQNTN